LDYHHRDYRIRKSCCCNLLKKERFTCNLLDPTCNFGLRKLAFSLRERFEIKVGEKRFTYTYNLDCGKPVFHLLKEEKIRHKSGEKIFTCIT
jgi:hypothetical protein